METEDTQAKEAVQALFNHTAELMITQRKSPEETKQILMNQGVSEESAQLLVDKVDGEIANAKGSRAKKDMLYGALWCIGGTAVTVLTYSAASGGGHYVIAWGAIVFGAIQFFKGLANLNSGD